MKNDEKHQLDYFEANGIVVTKNGVFVGGSGSDGSRIKARYWQNGTITKLGPAANTYAELQGMSVNGDDVYAAGTSRTNNINNIACYWKNGSIVYIGPDNDNTFAATILATGNDVYAGGFRYISTPALTTPYYWKNGVATQLDTAGGYVSGIALNNDDLYISGALRETTDKPKAVYWLNGIVHPLTSVYASTTGSNYAITSGIVLVRKN